MPLSCTSLAGGPTSAFMRPPYIGGKPRARPLARSKAHPSASGVKRAVKGLCIACRVGSKLGAGHPGAMHLQDAPAWIWGQRPGFRRRRHAHYSKGYASRPALKTTQAAWRTQSRRQGRGRSRRSTRDASVTNLSALAEVLESDPTLGRALSVRGCPAPESHFLRRLALGSTRIKCKSARRPTEASA
jgi:hypothetical protein